MGFFDSTKVTQNQNTQYNQTQNVDWTYNLADTKTLENIGNSSIYDAYKTTINNDSSFKAQDAFNRNVNYQLANVGNIFANPAAMTGDGLPFDMNAFFAKPAPFAGNNPPDAGFFGSPALAGIIPQNTIGKILLGVGVFVVTLLILKKFR
jgi:hypothetical protein